MFKQIISNWINSRRVNDIKVDRQILNKRNTHGFIWFLNKRNTHGGYK